MLENPRRGRQARNFTTNVSKILDLESSSEQAIQYSMNIALLFVFVFVCLFVCFFAVRVFLVIRTVPAWRYIGLLLLNGFVVRTESYRPSFFHSNLWTKNYEEAGYKTDGKKDPYFTVPIVKIRTLRSEDCDGFFNLLLEWFKSYMHNSKQYERIGSETSGMRKSTRGGAQGSILGPALFNVYVVINFSSQVMFIFLLSLSMLMYANEA